MDSVGLIRRSEARLRCIWSTGEVRDVRLFIRKPLTRQAWPVKCVRNDYIVQVGRVLLPALEYELKLTTHFMVK